MAIHSLGTSVAFEFFKSQAEFRKLCTAVSSLCPKTQMSHNFHRAVSSPTQVQLQHTLQASIHVLLYSQVCWIMLPWLWTKAGGSVRITTSFTTRKNELLDWFGTEDNLPCCLREVQELVQVAGKVVHAGSEACCDGEQYLVTFHLLSSAPTAWSARFTNTDLTQVYQKWQRTDRALSLMYLK